MTTDRSIGNLENQTEDFMTECLTSETFREQCIRSEHIVDEQFNFYQDSEEPLRLLTNFEIYSAKKHSSLEYSDLENIKEHRLCARGFIILPHDRNTISSPSNSSRNRNLLIHIDSIIEWALEYEKKWQQMLVWIRSKELFWYRLLQPTKNYAPIFSRLLLKIHFIKDISVIVQRKPRLKLESLVDQLAEQRMEREGPTDKSQIWQLLIDHKHFICQHFPFRDGSGYTIIKQLRSLKQIPESLSKPKSKKRTRNNKLDETEKSDRFSNKVKQEWISDDWTLSLLQESTIVDGKSLVCLFCNQMLSPKEVTSLPTFIRHLHTDREKFLASLTKAHRETMRRRFLFNTGRIRTILETCEKAENRGINLQTLDLFDSQNSIDTMKKDSTISSDHNDENDGKKINEDGGWINNCNGYINIGVDDHDDDDVVVFVK